MVSQRSRHSVRPASLLRLYRVYTDSAGTTVRTDRIYKSDGKVYSRSITTGEGRRKIKTRWTIIAKWSPRMLEVVRAQKLQRGWIEE